MISFAPKKKKKSRNTFWGWNIEYNIFLLITFHFIFHSNTENIFLLNQQNVSKTSVRNHHQSAHWDLS